MKEAIFIILVLHIGVAMGYCIRELIAHRFRNYDGVIRVTELENKTLYSLELEDDPEKIATQKELVFRVDVSDVENLDRN